MAGTTRRNLEIQDAADDRHVIAGDHLDRFQCRRRVLAGVERGRQRERAAQPARAGDDGSSSDTRDFEKVGAASAADHDDAVSQAASSLPVTVFLPGRPAPFIEASLTKTLLGFEGLTGPYFSGREAGPLSLFAARLLAATARRAAGPAPPRISDQFNSSRLWT